jgi:hypothetical protein
MDRREFCLAGAVMATSFAVARVLPATPILLAVVVFDSRFPIACNFGAAACLRGQKTLAIQGDVTALWRDDLRLRWASGAAPIGGMTTERSLFCLEQLARDHWLRVKTRRTVALDEPLVYWVIGGVDA